LFLLVELLIVKTACTRGILAKTPDPTETPILLRRSVALMFFQKSHSEKPGSEEIDAKIERRVAQHISELHEQLDERIRKQIQGDRDFVKDTVGVAFRVGAGAVTLLVVVLGALGWKNIGEITNDLVLTVKREVQAQFATSEGKQIIDSVLDRAVLNSYLTQMALLKTDKAQRFRIEDHDADRLLRIVKNAETDNVTFEAAAKVLITALSQEGPGTLRFALVSDICETFAGLITAKGRDEKWLANNYQKRMWLLTELSETGFSHDLLRVAYRDLLDTSASLPLRQAAVENIGKVRDSQALAKLVQLVSTNSDLRLNALVAIARIESGNKTLADWTANLDKVSAPSVQELIAGLKISRNLYESNRTASMKLVQLAASHSYLLTTTVSESLLERRLQDRVFVVPLMKLNSMTNAESVSPAAILVDQDNSWTLPVQELLENFARQNDLKEFRTFVTWLTPGSLVELSPKSRVRQRPLFAVEISISKNAAIVLESGVKLDRSSAPNGVWLSADRRVIDKVSGQLLVMDSQGDDGTTFGVLSSFENAGDLGFRVRY
jgi:hypothetical protein